MGEYTQHGEPAATCTICPPDEDHWASARRYIAGQIAIMREHGMTREVPKDLREEAVAKVARSVERLHRLAARSRQQDADG